MARTFQTFKTHADPETGKRIDLLDEKGRKIPHPRWRFEIIDWQGKRRIKTGYPTKTETEKLAQRVQSQEDEIRKGYRPPPRSADKHGRRPFADVRDEYLEWGNSQGGHNGGKWSYMHRHQRDVRLKKLESLLGLEILSDLYGILPRFERVLREMQAGGLSGKTLNHFRETLHAFCEWSVSRGYLTDNPLKGLDKFNSEPLTHRRVLTLDEIESLLQTAPPDRGLVYEVALGTGLRAGELRALKVYDLNRDLRAINLRPEITKNRKPGLQPLPRELFDRLVQSVEGKEPDAPLLQITSHLCREMDKDLIAAGIPKNIIGQGKLDFHALRGTFITLLIENGGNVKEVQTLARHSDPRLTMNIYAKASNKRLAELADTLGKVLPFSNPTTGPQREMVIAGNPVKSRVLRVEDKGFEPSTSALRTQRSPN